MKRINGIITVLIALSLFAGSIGLAQNYIWGTKSTTKTEQPKQGVSQIEKNTTKSTKCIRPKGKPCKSPIALPIGSHCCCDTSEGRDCTGRIAR